MTDCPQLTPECDVINHDHQPFTVLLLMSDDIRADESCAADWVRRVWVYGIPGEHGTDAMIAQARSKLAEMFEWADPELGLTPEDIEQRKDAMEPVAVYPGHLFDIYRP